MTKERKEELDLLAYKFYNENVFIADVVGEILKVSKTNGHPSRAEAMYLVVKYLDESNLDPAVCSELLHQLENL